MTVDGALSATNTLRFILDGRLVELADVPPTLTVLEYLREIARRMGTKEGCAEGDCGACTVVLGELAADGQRIGYRAINACIRLLATIDGRELVTVESLQDEHGALHPVQQAMVEQHASQCGFCTPGFVMSLFGLYLQGDAPTRESVVECVAGNLCRCTGYRPIIAAGCRMGSYPAPGRWSRQDAQRPERIAALRALRRTQPLSMPGFSAPRTLDELAAALEREPHAVLLAGGTDIGLWVTKQLRELPMIIYLGEVRELQQVRRDAGALSIGAAVSLAEGWGAIVGAYPELAELMQRFGSPPVRHSGTLCGNLANGSPIGDSMPALIALGAELELRRGQQTRRLPLERFYLGYQSKDLRPGEFVAAVIVPARRAGERIGSYKVSKRFEQDISAVCAAFSVQLEGGRVIGARIAYGGMAAVPARALASERALIGQPWNEDSVIAAAARLAEDFQPLTDLRATAPYRLRVAGNLLRRFYLEQSDPAAHVRTAHAAAALQ